METVRKMNLTVLLTATIYFSTPNNSIFEIYNNGENKDWFSLNKTVLSNRNEGHEMGKIYKVSQVSIDNDLLAKYNEDGINSDIMKYFVQHISTSINPKMNTSTHKMMSISRNKLKISDKRTLNKNSRKKRYLYQSTNRFMNPLQIIARSVDKIANVAEDLWSHFIVGNFDTRIIGGTPALQYLPITHKFRRDINNDNESDKTSENKYTLNFD